MIPIAENKPRVSVLIPAYNHEKFVEDAILSVVNQTYGYDNIELIVTDDCSSDNTVEKLQRLQQQYGFRLILHHKNFGVSSTLNEMILLTNSLYITSFASDDVMVPDRIQNQINILQNHPEIDILAGTSILIDEKGNQISDIQRNNNDFLESFTFEDIFLLNWPGFTAGSVIIKSNLFKRIGSYDPNIKVEDYYFWLKASFNNAKIVRCNIPFLYYRIHGNSISTNDTLLKDEVAKILALYKSHPQYNTALLNHKIYNLSKMVFKSKRKVLYHIVNEPNLLLNKKTIKILIMLLLPSSILKSKFPENYYRNAG